MRHLPEHIQASESPGNDLYQELQKLPGIGELRARYVAGLFVQSHYASKAVVYVDGVRAKDTYNENNLWNNFLYLLLHDPEKLYSLHNKRFIPPVNIGAGALNGRNIPALEKHLEFAGNARQRFDRESIRILRAWALPWADPILPSGKEDWLGGMMFNMSKFK